MAEIIMKSINVTYSRNAVFRREGRVYNVTFNYCTSGEYKMSVEEVLNIISKILNRPSNFYFEPYVTCESCSYITDANWCVYVDLDNLNANELSKTKLIRKEIEKEILAH